MLSRTSTRSPAEAPVNGRALLAVVLVAGAVKLGTMAFDARESVRHVTLVCEGERCTASVDGGESMTVEAPGPPAGNKLGMYVFHSHEFDEPQGFRNLTIEADSDPSRALSLAFDETSQLSHFELDPGWRIHRSLGLTHEGEPGTRAIALTRSGRNSDFTLNLDLISTVDSGILFRATDRGNGMLFVARSRYNDALFCELRDDEVGPVLGLMPLTRLRVGRESIRLAGLVAEIVISAGLLLGALIFAMRWLPDVIWRGGRRREPWIRDPRGLGWPALVFAVTFAALLLVSVFGLRGIPHIQDEGAYLFQAKIFASGEWSAPAPSRPEFFDHEHIVTTSERWFSKYPPLFPLILSVGVLVGAPWIIGPVLGGLTAVVVFATARELGNGRTGWIAWGLTLSSPFFLIMGGSMMSHMAAALFVSLFLLFLVRAIERGAPGQALVAGACLGAALLTRPYTAFLAAVGAGVYGAVVLVGSPRRSELAKIYAVLALAVLPFLFGYLAWNNLHTESSGPAVSLYDTYNETDRLGFGDDKGHGWLKTWGSWGHTPAKALRSVHQYLDHTSSHLFGWPARLSLAFVLAALLWAVPRKHNWLLFGLFLMLVAGHMLYWATQHLVYGARYWFSAVPALAVLSALGIQAMLRRSSAGGFPSASRVVATGAVVAVLISSNLVIYLPRCVKALPGYGGVDSDLKDAVEASRLRDAVVFVPTSGPLFDDGFYMNDPHLRGPVIFARDLGDQNAELLAEFPDREAWRWAEGRLEPLSPRTAWTAGAQPAAGGGP
ncbi:MAG: glycosyltransferase family 39 protein [Acidobacteriota bacterium]|nr:glycosyltransferase family 39 protein [Acidobacteriota bacterium]